MQFVKNKKGEYVIDDQPMHLSGKAAAAALAEIEGGVSTNPNRDKVLAECRAALKAKRATGSR